MIAPTVGKVDAQPIHVMHVASVEVDNYYLNNLVDFTPRDAIRYSAVTFAPPAGFVDGMRARGVPVWALDSLQRTRYPRAVHALGALIRREQPDIIHTHLFDSTLIGVALGRLMRRRIVVTRHHSDAIHTLPDRWKRWGYSALESFINRSADRIIAPSRKVFEILTEREHVPLARVQIIPYGQTFERFAAVTPADIERVRSEFCLAGSYAIVTVCRLHPEKGHRFLLDAFHRFIEAEPRARLVLVGTGPIEDELRRRVDALGLATRVTFAGWRNDALALLACADLVVHPSLHEALPSAVIEALALERPLVVTDVSGARDLVGESEHGYLVPMADAQALLSAMWEVHAQPEEARKRARSGRHHVLTSLEAAKVSESHVGCYRSVMAGKRAGCRLWRLLARESDKT